MPEYETTDILAKCHEAPYDGHCGGQRTAAKVLQSGYFWPTLFHDVKDFVIKCGRCQRIGNLTHRDELL